jgi:hypothetical protein
MVTDMLVILRATWLAVPKYSGTKANHITQVVYMVKPKKKITKTRTNVSSTITRTLATNYSILGVFNRAEIWRAWVRVNFFSILIKLNARFLILDFLMGFESYLCKPRISVSNGRYKPTGKHRHSLRQVRLSLVCAQIFPRTQPMREYNTVRAIFLVCLCQRKNLLMSEPV